MRRSRTCGSSRSSRDGRTAGRSSIGPSVRAGSGSGRRGRLRRRATSAVVVDPGRAFGTGAHPTTRACIELLAALERGSLLDAGCGSGVVAVAAVRLGFAPVRAVDLDDVAVEVARETAHANGVDVEVSHADVLHDELPRRRRRRREHRARRRRALLARVPARLAVTSGYLASETPGVRAGRTSIGSSSRAGLRTFWPERH